MAVDDRAQRRARFLRELAGRDLYEWFGIPPDAGDDAIREAAERKRRELASTPMPQRTRQIERAFCDQGEKVLLRSDYRRDYDALLRASRTPESTGQNRAAAEREARLRAARERIERYGDDDARMAPGAATLLAAPDARERLEAERATAAAVADPAEALAAARRARVEGESLRALAFAERAHALAATPRALTTLAGARRDVGDLAGSEAAAREGLRQLPTVRENAPGWTALGATLRARGELRRRGRRRRPPDRGGRGGPARLAGHGPGRHRPRRDPAGGRGVGALRPPGPRRPRGAGRPRGAAARQPGPQRLARGGRHREPHRADQAGLSPRSRQAGPSRRRSPWSRSHARGVR